MKFLYDVNVYLYIYKLILVCKIYTNKKKTFYVTNTLCLYFSFHPLFYGHKNTTKEQSSPDMTLYFVDDYYTILIGGC